MFRNFGWEVVIVKYGRLMQAAFAEPGGEALRRWIDNCPNQMYAALCFQGGAAFRKHLQDDIGDQGQVSQLIDRRSDDELLALMSNLGGHDMASMIEAFEAIDHDRPVCFIAYTIKGVGLPMQGHKDNHAGLMTVAQMEKWRARRTFAPAMNGTSSKACRRRTPNSKHLWQRRSIRMAAAVSPRPSSTFRNSSPSSRRRRCPPNKALAWCSTSCARRQRTGFAHRHRVARRHRVDQSRRLGQPPRLVCQGRKPRSVPAGENPLDLQLGLFAQGAASELGIAEMNLFIMLSALGLSHAINGERLLPVGTLYDPFIERGLDALNYACYQDARFMVVATPSGITLAPEGGAHQSIATPLIGMAQDGLASFEPAFVDELAVIMGWGFRHMQREAARAVRSICVLDPHAGPAAAHHAGAATGHHRGRLPAARAGAELRHRDRLYRRGGAEAIEAVGFIGESHRDVGRLAATSPTGCMPGGPPRGIARPPWHPVSQPCRKLLAPLRATAAS